MWQYPAPPPNKDSLLSLGLEAQGLTLGMITEDSGTT